MSGYAERLPGDLITSYDKKQGKARSETTTLQGSDSEIIKPPRAYKWRQRLGWVALSATIAESLYVFPIDYAEHQLADTHASIQESLQPTDAIDADAASVVIGGFGTRNSAPIVEALSPLDEIGSVYSVEEDNKGVDAEVMAKQILAEAEAKGQTEIGLWGTSVGGIIVTQIARYIQENNSPVRVRYIMLDCTPPSYEALRKNKQQELQLMETLNKAAPGIDINPVSQYIWSAVSIGKLAPGEVSDYMDDPETASTQLQESQASYVIDSQMKQNLTAIGKVNNKPKPLVMTARPVDPNGDAIVNSVEQSKQLRDYADAAGLTLLEFQLDGISHGDPTANRAAYQTALKERILPALQEYENIINEKTVLVAQHGPVKHF